MSPSSLSAMPSDGLDGAGLGEDLAGGVAVQEGDELLGGVDVLGAGGDPGLLEPGVAVAVAALFDGGQGGHAPLEAVSAGGLGHLAHDPGAVGHEQGLVVQHELLVLE